MSDLNITAVSEDIYVVEMPAEKGDPGIIAPVANNTIVGNISGSTAAPIGLTVEQVRGMLLPTYTGAPTQKFLSNTSGVLDWSTVDLSQHARKDQANTFTQAQTFNAAINNLTIDRPSAHQNRLRLVADDVRGVVVQSNDDSYALFAVANGAAGYPLKVRSYGIEVTGTSTNNLATFYGPAVDYPGILVGASGSNNIGIAWDRIGNVGQIQTSAYGYPITINNGSLRIAAGNGNGAVTVGGTLGVTGALSATRVVAGGITDGGSSGKFYGYGLVTDWLTYDRAGLSTASSQYLDLDAAGALWLRSGRDNGAAARVMSNAGLIVRNRADSADGPLTAGAGTFSGAIEQRNGTTWVDPHRVYGSYTSGSVYHRLSLGHQVDSVTYGIGTETNAGSYRLAFTQNGTPRFGFDSSGNYIPWTTNTYDVGTSPNRVKKVWAVEGDFSGPLFSASGGTSSSINGVLMNYGSVTASGITIGNAGRFRGEGANLLGLTTPDQTLYASLKLEAVDAQGSVTSWGNVDTSTATNRVALGFSASNATLVLATATASKNIRIDNNGGTLRLMTDNGVVRAEADSRGFVADFLASGASNTVGAGKLSLGATTGKQWSWRLDTTNNNLILDSEYAGWTGSRLHIDRQYGYVGIGKVPTVALDVNGAITASGNLRVTTANSSGDANGPATISNTHNATYVEGLAVIAPNLTAGNGVYFVVGRNGANNNWATFAFNYVGNGSASNSLDVLFYGGTTKLRVAASGDVSIPAGNLNVTGNIAASGAITSTHSSSLTDLSTLDLSTGQSRLHKNTTSGLIKVFVNDAGVMKSVTLT